MLIAQRLLINCLNQKKLLTLSLSTDIIELQDTEKVNNFFSVHIINYGYLAQGKYISLGLGKCFYNTIFLIYWRRFFIMRNKKVKGFTLIELIVVIAIIAVLAAILIPNLMNWVGKSSLRTANTNAKAVATNSATILAELETAGVYLSGGGSGTYTAELKFEGTIPESMGSFEKAVAKAAGLPKDSVWGVEFDEQGEVLGSYWAKESGSPYIGTYPNETQKKNETTVGGALAFAQGEKD